MTSIKQMCMLLLLLLLVYLPVAFLQGCGKDSSGSETERQYDRDREATDVITKLYSVINGTFAGVANNSDIILVVKTTMVTTQGSTVPTPTLVGTMVFSPRVTVGDSKDRVKAFFPYTDGTYDKGSGSLSFTVEKEQRPTQVVCKTTPDKFTCSWFRRMNDVDFTLTRTSDNALQRLDSKKSGLFGGSYLGRASDGFLVKAEFNPALSNKPDSSIPELAVMGYFTFYPESEKTPDDKGVTDVAGFTDGSYDVSSATIAMTVATSVGSTSIPVNCQVESADSIFCRWFAHDYIEFRLHKEKNKPVKPQP